MALPTIFFVPGAWHETWVFDDVRSALSNRGFETDVSALPTVGSDTSIGVFEDAAVVRPALLKLVDAGKEVVIVSHSYGGIVAANSVRGLSIDQRTADSKAGGIMIFLYLAAFAIPADMSLLMAFENVFPSWWNVTEVKHSLQPSYLVNCQSIAKALTGCRVGPQCHDTY